MFIPITPMGAPRQTQRDRWKQRPVIIRYHVFRDELRLKYRDELPLSVQLIFYMPIPKSWSKKKQLEKAHDPHDEKPDLDNLIKAVLDALMPEDKKVFEVYASKFWGLEPGIEIRELLG